MKKYNVLYTHQKTKKAKVWQDGVLKEVNNTKLSLHSDNGRHIESVFYRADKVEVGEEIESDAYLILIDSEDKENTAPSVQHEVPPKQPLPVKPTFGRPGTVGRRFVPPILRSPQQPWNAGSESVKGPGANDAGIPKLQEHGLLAKFNQRKMFSSVIKKNETLLHPAQSREGKSFGNSSENRSTKPATMKLWSTPSDNTSIWGTHSQQYNISDDIKQQSIELPNTEADDESGHIEEWGDSLQGFGAETSSSDGFWGTPAPAPQRSLDGIFRALETPVTLQNPPDQVQPSSSENGLFHNQAYKTKVPQPAQSLNEEQIDLQVEDTIDSSFDCLDEESLFGPSPPPSSLDSVPASLDKLISDKIDRIPEPASKLYETVDYSDIVECEVECEMVEREVFKPNSIQFCTQQSSDVHAYTLLSDPAHSNRTNISTQQTGDLEPVYIEQSNRIQKHSTNVKSEVKDEGMTFGVWNGGESQPERQSKRRKLSDLLRKPRAVPHETNTHDGKAVRKFTVPFGNTSAPEQRHLEMASKDRLQLKWDVEPQKRSCCIPVAYESGVNYKLAMLDAIYEHLNVGLANLCTRYKRTKSDSCSHGPPKVGSVTKEGPNKGRSFLTCPKNACKMFRWTDSKVDSPQEQFRHYSKHGVSFYAKCKLKRRNNLYLLELSTQDKHSAYNKEDIWIINPDSSKASLLISTYYGPSSSGAVELRLLNNHVPQCGVTCNAVHALRGVSELQIAAALDKVASLPLLPALLGKQSEASVCGDIQLNANTPEIAVSICREYQLNERQEEAALSFIASLQNGCPVLLIQGVFGSGKSYLLAVIVVILTRVLADRHRILITSTTNVAVDNILIKLLEMGYNKFARVGSAKRIHKKITPFLQDASLLSDLGSYRVIGSTCASSPGVSLRDIVLMDEVSQITEPSSLLPLIHSSCKRLILVGDPQQLPPTVETQHVQGEGARGLEQTLFDRLSLLAYPIVVLNTQYRCPREISRISNTLFYNGSLLDGNPNNIPSLPILPLCFVSVSGIETLSGDSYSNQAEMRGIRDIVEYSLRHGISKEDMAVITLYRGQELLLKKELANHRNLKISTVDAVQGAEKSVVILSCVRTSRIGFADCPKRVNVAITRATKHLIILGNLQMLSSNQLWGTIIHMCAEDQAVFTLPDILEKLKI